MASNAFSGHLLPILDDADHFYDAAKQLPSGMAGRRLRIAALNRAVVVTCVSAWEGYIEELVPEALNVLRPAAPPLGLWPTLNAVVRGQLGRFNNPNTENIRLLISDVVGLPDIRTCWVWRNCTPAQAVQRLADVMSLRHQIAHGVNPRPVVATIYSSKLVDFFTNLARYTNLAVRIHFTNVLGVANPWPS